MRTLKHQHCRSSGFTLIETIMVIVITGIIGGMVAIFIKKPIDAYFDSARRAALTDVADTAVRRMSRDIRKALPNSINVPNNQCIEFIPTKTGGRYRAETDNTGAGNFLDFITTAPVDTSFNMLGNNNDLSADQRIANGDVIVVYNLGILGANAYNQDNTAMVVGAPSVSGETTITISSRPTPFPLASGSNRFHVIPATENIVAYVCSGGTLYRTTRALSAATPLDLACPNATSGAMLANHLDTANGCNFDYTGSDLQRNALVKLTIKFTDKDETVSLYHEVHVNNTP